MVNNTAPCDQLEAIYTSTLHLTRGTTFQGNIPFKTKFVCGIQHPALDGVIQYSENSHYVNFAVNLTSVILKDVNDNALPSTMELAQGSVVILKCVTSTSRPTATVRWYIGSTNVVSGVENIAKPGENGLEYMESNLTFTLNSNEHHSKYIYCQAYSSLSSSVLQSTQHMLSVTGK
ncbi:hypothetical protein ACJMK2_006917 [Sinanodonta woodiana]|uniref:Ig-like domain-containing protein n=1 Tax=Sinanodonta woodiana TaxID=1069815 RepID=A0ABD3VUP6_SINWO